MMASGPHVRVRITSAKPDCKHFRAIGPIDSASSHSIVKTGQYKPLMSYDPSTIATLRRALDEILLDPRFHRRKTISALEVAEHLLAEARSGERNLDKLKISAFDRLISNVERLPNKAA
jgi:hypothetical protein